MIERKRSNRWGWLIRRFLLPFAMIAPLQAVHSDTTLPYNTPHLRLGVVTCASAKCHGAIEEKSTTRILQNEYVLWSREDPHSKAYKGLFSKQSKAIAAKLGVKKPHQADLCTDCHTHNVPRALQGDRFQLDNGVDCEVCHGPAEKWIETHTVENRPFQENIAEGMYEVADPLARARLCYACHTGMGNQFLDHKLYGAGHPRLRFELDNFSATQPAHFVIDREYAQRKGDVSNLKMWFAGQLISAEYFLNNLLDPSIRSQGLSVELSLLDCHSCHHSFEQENWRSVSHQGLKPGVLRFNDTPFFMVHLTLQSLGHGQSKSLIRSLKAFHASSDRNWSEVDKKAKQLQQEIDKLTAEFKQIKFKQANVNALLKILLDAGKGPAVRDLLLAEQIAWGLEASLYFAQNSDMMTDSQLGSLDKELSQLFKLISEEKNYSAARYRKSIKNIAAKLDGIL